jgi:hypothetical protein
VLSFLRDRLGSGSMTNAILVVMRSLGRWRVNAG